MGDNMAYVESSAEGFIEVAQKLLKGIIESGGEGEGEIGVKGKYVFATDNPQRYIVVDKTEVEIYPRGEMK